MNWRALIYQIPREPQKNRVAVWRRLKSVGSLNVLQSIWILPDNDENKEEFLKLAEQIKEVGGRAFTCIITIDDEEQNRALIDGFNKEREIDYEEVLEKCEDFEKEIEKEIKRQNFTFAELDENEEEVEKLFKWFKKIEKKDYFNCPLKSEVIKALEKCKILLNDFRNIVYERDEENGFRFK